MNRQEGKIRVLISKPNIDGHWRGVYAVSHALSNAGMEVLFIGYSNPETTVVTAIQEDVDVIGLSLYCCDNIVVVSEVMRLLEEKNVQDMIVIAGGTFGSAEQIAKVKELGVAEVFPPGSPAAGIATFIRSKVKKRGDKQ